jgi:hypothetical protein
MYYLLSCTSISIYVLPAFLQQQMYICITSFPAPADLYMYYPAFCVVCRHYLCITLPLLRFAAFCRVVMESRYGDKGDGRNKQEEGKWGHRLSRDRG